MYSNMCVKMVLCLALIVSIDGYVLTHRTLPLSAEGMTVEITVTNKDDRRHPLSTMKIDINEKDKKVEMSMAEALSAVPKHIFKSHSHDIVPTLENRNGIRVGACPQGTVGRRGFCFPTDDA